MRLARTKLLFSIFMAFIAVSSCLANPGEDVSIGSKKFTESVIVADLAAELSASTGARVSHRRELGGTRLLWDALVAHEIDIYPEYTGTLTGEILASERVVDKDILDQALAKRGLKMSRPLGFSDAYAIGMRAQEAERLGIRSISDLSQHPELRFGFSDEFLSRVDGWPALRAAYGLANADTHGLDHDVSYRGLIEGSIDVIDLYVTDAEISFYNLRILEDDRKVLRENKAVFLYRADLEKRAPKSRAAILRLEGRIDQKSIVSMNREVKFGRRTEAAVAAEFLAAKLGLAVSEAAEGLGSRLFRRTLEHVRLVAFSLGPAILVALPLGVVAARRPALGRAILAAASIIQTLPSLALLVFMMPILGIGPTPAIAALFLYSLLPIIRNTTSGLENIPISIRNSALALGLSPVRRLLIIELPIASPLIISGIKTAAVIDIGTATLGALIGAGGYGQPIFTGIRLDNFGLILEGAAPAAALALLVQGLFETAETFLVPRGLRLRPNE